MSDGASRERPRTLATHVVAITVLRYDVRSKMPVIGGSARFTTARWVKVR